MNRSQPRIFLLLFCSTLFCINAASISFAQDSNSAKVPENYENLHTVQLAAFKTKDETIAYSRNFNLPADEMGVVYLYSGNDYWYILAYGVYQSGSEAIQAAKDVCADNNARGCWARNLKKMDELARQARADNPNAKP